MYTELTTPAVVVDLDIAERNISRMAELLRNKGIAHRPHIKTTKSAYFANKQLAAGASGITVAKLSEAETFVELGIDHILVAYSIVGEDKLQHLEALQKKAHIIVTVDSMEAAEGLSSVGVRSGQSVEVLIEVDGGLHRGGRQPGEDTLAFARAISELAGIRLKGIMGYFGTIYRNKDEESFRKAAGHESLVLSETASLLKDAGFCTEIISGGSSPAALMCENLDGVTEVRAGNYIFFDASGVSMGLAGESDCALRIIATVVSVPLPGRATIDAGTKTLTSDKAHHREGFGIVTGLPDVQITGLNEEHGFLEFDIAKVQLRVGDRVEIIPNHSCVIPNLCNTITGVRKGKPVEIIKVDARGCNY
ncbi:alanine racemase [Paenibacillus eucommiae]|uniref:D-serine deaminase-like pyridoxal phosphate-dependent protein n=1 Tax=Paenibacillus eucommiae TaxID=1355755 RepID=A0ABS4IWZ1_9BACL|nr:alanine racemase [Paenibacillus eucommiae]MBP1992112.1 D-serine deaminase-like pyridoxal phosphate-dependent protein [Paenibacillus eucommiae]